MWPSSRSHSGCSKSGKRHYLRTTAIKALINYNESDVDEALKIKIGSGLEI